MDFQKYTYYMWDAMPDTQYLYRVHREGSFHVYDVTEYFNEKELKWKEGNNPRASKYRYEVTREQAMMYTNKRKMARELLK